MRALLASSTSLLTRFAVVPFEEGGGVMRWTLPSFILGRVAKAIPSSHSELANECAARTASFSTGVSRCKVLCSSLNAKIARSAGDSSTFVFFDHPICERAFPPSAGCTLGDGDAGNLCPMCA